MLKVRTLATKVWTDFFLWYVAKKNHIISDTADNPKYYTVITTNI